MVKKKETKPSINKYDIDGHKVVIRKEGDIELLLVDDKPRKFYKSEDGYILNDNIYAAPVKSLLEAVKNQLKVTSKESDSD